MKSPYQHVVYSIWRLIGVLAIVIAPAMVTAQSLEPYSVRPHISEVQAQSHELGSGWNNLKAAHFSFVALILELYPDREIYFLARDAELLYDTAYLVATPEENERIHLLNISRANMRADGVKEYLAQNGISNTELEAGKKILFVDTGFSGTIPGVINSYLSKKAQKNIRTHLIASSDSEFPSGRSFLFHLNPGINGLNPGQMHGTILSYEHMPRYTDRSKSFATVNDMIEPMSMVDKASDGSVNPQVALSYMQDLKSAWKSKSTKSAFATERLKIRKILYLIVQSDSDKTERINELKKIIQASKFNEAVIRDAIDAQGKTIDADESIDLLDLNLAEESFSNDEYSNKAKLIRKYPQWQHILEDPEGEIPKLFATNDVQTIGALFDSINDEEVLKLLVIELGKDHGPVADVWIKKLISALIKKGDPDIIYGLITYTFPDAHTKDTQDLIRLLIKKGDPDILRGLVQYTFSQPHTKDMHDLIRLLIEKGDQSVLGSLAIFTFSKPYAKDMQDLIRMLIDKGDQHVLRTLAWSTFSQPHTKDMQDLIRLLIEKGNEDVLGFLAQHTFSQPHTKDMQDLIRLLIEKGDQSVLRSLATFTFHHPHTKDMQDLIRLLVERGDEKVLWSLANRTFSQPHTKDMQDLIRLFIEKANKYLLRSLTKNTFSQPHTKDMKILKAAAKIADQNERIDFLNKNLGKAKIPSKNECSALLTAI